MSRINKRALAFPFATGAFIASSLALSTVLFPANTTSAAGNSAGVEVGTKVGEFISLALDTSNLVLEDSNGNTTIIPTAAGTLVTGNVEAAVSTNTPKGYTLSVYTEDQSTGMTHSNSSISTAINSISTATGYNASTGISDLAGDTWGFRNNVGGTLSNWFAVGANSSNGTVVASPDSSSSTYCDTISYPLNNSGCANSSYGTHTVNFGAKLTSALPAGSYSNNVVFSAIAKSEGTSYTVNFNSNGGNNTMGSRTILAGSTFTIPSTSNVTKDGYEIAGYAFTSNASAAAYTPGQTVQVDSFLTAATTAGQTPANGITLYAVWESTVKYCSDSVHPTTSEGCVMADGKEWIIGNSGNTITWNNMFTGATNVDGHDATVNSGICPAGYSAPKITDYDTLVQAYGGVSDNFQRNGYLIYGDTLYRLLGPSSYHGFWSSTEADDYFAYRLYAGEYSASTTETNQKDTDENNEEVDGLGYVLCYK